MLRYPIYTAIELFFNLILFTKIKYLIKINSIVMQKNLFLDIIELKQKNSQN